MRSVLLLCLALALPLSGCDDDDDDEDDDDDDAVAEPCAEGPLFTDEAAARGLDQAISDPTAGDPDAGGHTNVIARDLDGDGDLDILLSPLDPGIAIYENDGTGHFTLHPDAVDIGGGNPPDPLAALSAVDVDGDGLADIVQGGLGWIALARNEGGMHFADRTDLRREAGEEDHFYVGHQLADMDGDGDLDILAPAQLLGGSEEDLDQVTHRILLQDGGAFADSIVLTPAIAPIDIQAVTAGDLDDDGDLDVLLLGDVGPTSAIFRNDGGGSFVDVTAVLGFDRDIAAMGMDGADLNGDGILDWCVTDLGSPPCWVSNGDKFIESGLALGLTPDEPGSPHTTVGWSLELVDFDNDGLLDAAQSSAPEDRTQSYPDLLWRGLPGGTFEDVSELSGFHSDDAHWGMAAGDFDGDGFLDLIAAGNGTVPQLLMNQCTEGAWVEVALRGPKLNAEGYGATVEVDTASQTRKRHLLGLRGQGQGPARVHFGLGSEDAPVTIRVSWPDGEESVVAGAETGQLQIVVHPSW